MNTDIKNKNTFNQLNNLIRVGNVVSVDVEKGTARVFFPALNLTSGNLKILQNQPLITITKTENGSEWDFEAQYNSVDRGLKLGESYVKRSKPDYIKLQRDIDYQCPLHGIDETKHHSHIVKIYPWMPYIDEMVVCIYLPFGDYHGFVLGGISV